MVYVTWCNPEDDEPNIFLVIHERKQKSSARKTG